VSKQKNKIRDSESHGRQLINVCRLGALATHRHRHSLLLVNLKLIQCFWLYFLRLDCWFVYSL